MREIVSITPDTLDRFTNERALRALEKASDRRRRKGQPITRDLRETIFELIASGLDPTTACDAANVSPQAFRNLCNKHPHLQLQLDEAIDLGQARIIQKLQYIVEHGDINGMPTVRAAEILLRQSPRFQQWNSNAKAEITAPSGHKMSVRIGTPGPD